MMEPNDLRSRLSAVIAFPITPFKTDLSRDIEGLRANLAKLLEHPVCAIVAPGGTGEMYSLTPEEHLQVVRTTVEAAQSHVPVIAGVGFGQRLAIKLARSSAEAGGAGILAFPPYHPHAQTKAIRAPYLTI